MPEPAASLPTAASPKALRLQATDLIQRGDVLERDGQFPEAWKSLADGAVLAARSRGQDSSNEWDGTITAGQPLTVVRMMRHAGAQLRMVRALHALVQAGMEITLVTEARLLPLFRRSFPQINVIGEDAPRPDGPWAAYERVAQYVWRSAKEISQNSRPLVADPAHAARLRARYLPASDKTGATPLIGVSWWSSNVRKDLPSPGVLAAALRHLPGQFVSLQYNPQDAGVQTLSAAMAPASIQSDPNIDPLTDMDASAAQIAAMDIVISVSNTTVHMAGALGRPCIMLMDDHPHLIWPPAAPKSVFYDSVQILRKNGRSWAETCQDAVAMAQDHFAMSHSSNTSAL
jgi:hypothetical protein